MRSAVGREPAVSVIIPTLNGGAEFRACLEAVHRQQLDRPFEVLCIDSGSTDDTLRRCQERGVGLLQIPPGTFNHGLTRNEAISAARGEYVALLTQDAVPVGTDWLHHLVEALDSVPRAAGAYGRQLLRSTTVNPYQRWRLEHWAATRAERVIQEITDREAFEARSPLEKLAVVAFDWSLRVLRAGYAVVYEPRARMLHSHNDSLWRDFKRVYSDHRNLNRLLGMRQMPTLGRVFRCTVSGVGALWRTVPMPPGSRARRLYWRLYALPWTLAQNAAQYLGARSNGPVRPPWSWIDRLVRAT